MTTSFKPGAKNAFRKWWYDGPTTRTHTTIAEQLGVHPTYVTHLMREDADRAPSWAILQKIEEITEGAVTMEAYMAFVTENKRAKAAKAAA